MQTRAKDHFMIQFGGASWQNRPSTIRTTGFSRTFNLYLMYDFPFKSTPNLSIALGPGISNDNVFLDKMSAGITGTGSTIVFKDLKDSAHFKKYKVATSFLELPVELRFSSKPEADGKSFKVAVGAKVGTMLAAWEKGKTLENASVTVTNDYILKDKSKRFFNTTRISATGRIGYGHFSVFGTYSLTSLFKEGVGPKMNAMSIGLAISGL